MKHYGRQPKKSDSQPITSEDLVEKVTPKEDEEKTTDHISIIDIKDVIEDAVEQPFDFDEEEDSEEEV